MTPYKTAGRPRVVPVVAGGALPRLCFVGPMLGVNPGWVTTQGEILAGLLADALAR